MNDFNKKWLAITIGLAISGGLLSLIMNQFQAEKQDDVWLNPNSQQNTELSVGTPEGQGSEGESGSNLNVPSISGGETAENNSSPPIILTDTSGNILDSHPDPNVTIPEAGTMNGDDQGTSQTIQPDIAPKPTYNQAQMTDPSQTPDGGGVIVTESGEIEAETKEESPQEVKPIPSTEPTSPDTTSSGTTSESYAPNPDATPESYTGSTEGMAYVPGFGWLPKTGPTEVIQATDMYQNGNKVGKM